MSSSNSTVPYHVGSCLCGTIRYSLSSPPTQCVLCHCNNCQKSSGSAFMTNNWYPANVHTPFPPPCSAI
ncbi:hypothetical protein EV356DRAFT_502366 [Viridothelium virens]|uniref:CENP-V/GFA domain-containing protein n=1 Tax=Viridothelium virens TaxID=1048519 RepID=A0A6A6HMS6_VIRVR|nr:hypothetical protein EV356DRAFT_502366 [Viridothelium virens]